MKGQGRVNQGLGIRNQGPGKTSVGNPLTPIPYPLTPFFWTRLKSAFPLEGEVRFNEPLKGYTSFGIGGPADCLLTVTTMEKLLKLLALIREWEGEEETGEQGDGETGRRGDGERENAPTLPRFSDPTRGSAEGLSHHLPFFVLGKGTNLLVKDGGIRGLVVRLDGEFSRATVQGNQIIAGAACPLSSLLRLSIQHSLSSLEFTVGIPGSLGGAIHMNAGSAEEGIGDIIREVQLVYPDGSTEVLAAAAGTPAGAGGLVEETMGLGDWETWRQGDKETRKHPPLSLSPRPPVPPLPLSPSPRPPVPPSPHSLVQFAYRRCFLPREGIITRALVQLRRIERKEAIMAQIRERYRYRAAHQPLREKSAGCIFKNPPGESAGRLIEQAGLKGISIGGAQVSTIHANFINNRSDASCSDVLRLMDMIQKRVYHSFGIALEAEVQVVGEDKIEHLDCDMDSKLCLGKDCE